MPVTIDITAPCGRRPPHHSPHAPPAVSTRRPAARGAGHLQPAAGAGAGGRPAGGGQTGPPRSQGGAAAAVCEGKRVQAVTSGQSLWVQRAGPSKRVASRVHFPLTYPCRCRPSHGFAQVGGLALHFPLSFGGTRHQECLQERVRGHPGGRCRVRGQEAGCRACNCSAAEGKLPACTGEGQQALHPLRRVLAPPGPVASLLSPMPLPASPQRHSSEMDAANSNNSIPDNARWRLTSQ